MLAAITTPDHRVHVTDIARPTPGDGELLLRLEASGICGSDVHGIAHYPAGHVLGHEFVGRVEAIGANVASHKPGDRVTAIPFISCTRCAHCLLGDPTRCAEGKFIGRDTGTGSFGEYMVVQAQTSVLVPEHIPLASAAQIEPLAIALRIVERAAIQPGDRVLVMGAGPIGLAVTMWAGILGAGTITVTDPIASRRKLALEFGATWVVDPVTTDVAAHFRVHAGGQPQVVIECVGRPTSASDAIDLVGYEGTIVLAGVHRGSDELARLPALLKNLTIRYSTWYTLRHFEHTISMLSSGRLDPRAAVTHEIGLDDLDSHLLRLAEPNEMGKVLVRY